MKKEQLKGQNTAWKIAKDTALANQDKNNITPKADLRDPLLCKKGHLIYMMYHNLMKKEALTAKIH